MITFAEWDNLTDQGKRTVITLSQMKDGLYRVVTSYFVAGFIVKDKKVIHCAPILRKKLAYWITKAEYICA